MSLSPDKLQEILQRRMRIAAPKEKVPVTPRMLAGLAVPFLWAMVYPVDCFVLLFHVDGTFPGVLLALLTAAAFAVAMVFSPRDDVVPWEVVPEARQRTFFFVACGVALAGLALMRVAGADFQAYFNLALAMLTLLWLALPFLLLSGNTGALSLLLFSMRMGMVWWTSMFLLLVLRDGSGAAMDGSLPTGALGFMGVTFWWFLVTARQLSSGEAGVWPLFVPGWQRRYWLVLALSACLVLLWVLTGFTNDGEGAYGAGSYAPGFPFYDVAAFLEPFAFSRGRLLLLHAIPWRELFFPGAATGGGGFLHMLSGLHWLGLCCLAVAMPGTFAALFAAMRPRVALVYAGAVLLAALALAWQTVAVWREFALRPWMEGVCPHPPGAMHTWDCANWSLGGADYFMLQGQHVPVLAVCAVMLALAGVLALPFLRRRGQKR